MRLKTLWSDSIARQMLLLIAAAIIAGQIGNMVIVYVLPPPRVGEPIPFDAVATRTRQVRMALAHAPAAEHARLVKDRSDRRLRFSLVETPPRSVDDPVTGRLREMLAAKLGVDARDVRFGLLSAGALSRAPILLGRDASALRAPEAPGLPNIAELELAVRTGDAWLLIQARSTDEFVWLSRAAVPLAVTLLLLLPIALGLAHRMARRVRRFADVAERFGDTQRAEFLPEEGPREMRQVARALNRMQRRVQQAVDDRTLMAAAVSHDLRTPLARIQFRLNRIEPALREPIAEDLQQMEDIIASSLDLARGAADSGAVTAFDVGALIQGEVDERVDAGQDIDFSQSDRVPVVASITATHRVLNNLLDNALAYAGAARVSLRRESGHVVVAVEDDGPGIPPAMHEAVFEPFRRLEPSRSRTTGGTGLGLAIARNFARAAGGDLRIDAGYRGGTRFLFLIPAYRPERT